MENNKCDGFATSVTHCRALLKISQRQEASLTASSQKSNWQKKRIARATSLQCLVVVDGYISIVANYNSSQLMCWREYKREKRMKCGGFSTIRRVSTSAGFWSVFGDYSQQQPLIHIIVCQLFRRFWRRSFHARAENPLSLSHIHSTSAFDILTRISVADIIKPKVNICQIIYKNKKKIQLFFGVIYNTINNKSKKWKRCTHAEEFIDPPHPLEVDGSWGTP